MIASETLTLLSQLTGKTLERSDAEKLFLDLNAENAYAPSAMVGGMVEMLQLRYNALATSEQIEPVFSDILARDRFTGYYIHSALRTLYLDFALMRSSMAGQQNRNFLILGDFMNLSNVNDAIGRNTTNEVMATICGIYLHCMTRAGVVNWLFHRSMGDEITFIVMDTDLEKVKAGLEDAEKTTKEFTQMLGMERLRHKKYPNQQGMGLVTAHLALSPQLDHREIKLQLDEAVKNQKSQYQKFDWFGLRRPGVDPDQFHNRTSEQRIDKALHKFRSFRNTAQFSSDTNAIVGTRDALNPATMLLVGRAIAWPRDDRIEYLRFHHNNSKIMLRADIYNLGGLNATFGHDGADHVKAHLIRILYSTITAHDYIESGIEPKIFDCGGGIIDIVINTMPDNQLHRLIQSLQSNIHHQILCHSVENYADEHGLSFSGDGTISLAELKHPKMENAGTGLVMATHAVETKRSLMEIIERLDKITHRTKMHDFSYLWQDEDYKVFALRLNQEAEPVYIGREREVTGLHYLPFTDALRRYMKQEDLPAIFERPVGQISETLFGTDMQAVLGFKKAIRMLQDKNISDDEIETISTYEEMDARLKKEGLPPLSVVSTQNRPAFVNNERRSFRTMALAEKLENLPSAMISLILQAQASFRTLKIIQPHGHLSGAQAIQVLQEELSRFHLPKLSLENPGEQLTECLYALARFVDLTGAALERDMSIAMRDALHDFALHNLHDLASASGDVGEEMLSNKLEEYIEHQHPSVADRYDLLQRLVHDVSSLMDKAEKKEILEYDEMSRLKQVTVQLLDVIRTHVGQKRVTAEVANGSDRKF